MFSWAAIRARIKTVVAQFLPSQVLPKTSEGKPPIIPKLQPQKLRNNGKPQEKKHAKFNPRTAWMKKDIGGLFTTLTHESIEMSSELVTSRSGFETLCTYNWHENGKAIFVPGGPRKWKVPTLPIQLKRDVGYSYIDQHAFHTPDYPFEPTFQALSIMNPDVQLGKIDIITNRNSLRKLLDFVGGRRQDPFCIGLQMVKNTLFIGRRDRNARASISKNWHPSFGYNFERTFTRPEAGLDQSSSHHRVIRYSLGGLDCIVRFEVDAYYEDSTESELGGLEQQPADEITSPMSQVSLDEHSIAPPRARPGGRYQDATATILKGVLIPPSQLAEIKAKAVERIREALAQLWFSRTPYLLTGIHNTGKVNEVICSHIEPRFIGWETQNQDKLRKLVSLLADLKRITQWTEQRAATLICEKRDAPLQIFETIKGIDALPRAIVEKHWS